MPHDTTTTAPPPEVLELIERAVRDAVREGVAALLAEYAAQAATLDLPLAYRDGVQDAAGLVAEYLRVAETPGCDS